MRGLSADLQIWRLQSPALSKRFRVICSDNRGAGGTGAPDAPYSIAGIVEDLAALLDHLRIHSGNGRFRGTSDIRIQGPVSPTAFIERRS
jgi:pimeloyl-ACP methyl ester carboxylesterase